MVADIPSAIREVLRTWAPPPKRTVSQWADEHRYLSAESSSEPGKFFTSRAEFQRGIMDAISDPMIHTVVIQACSQSTGKTEILNNAVGFFIDQDPSPMLFVEPTVDMAKTWSKDRLAPMLRDTPVLQGKVKSARARDSGNTVLSKSFPGGHITAVGANSPAGLAMRPIRVVFLDEVDRFPESAGAEGDPAKLAIKRTTTFWNRKIAMSSSPTIKGLSRIEAALDESDKRAFVVPCPKCEALQTLRFAQIRWPADRPGEAYYECEVCREHLTDADRFWAIRRGEWRATCEAKRAGTAGFHLPEWYSTWKTMAEMALDFLEAKRGGPETLKVWTNTAAAETWEEEGETLSADTLTAPSRREKYEGVPHGVGILVASVDVQDDRLEGHVVGYGAGEESWIVDFHQVFGDPGKQTTWDELDEWLLSEWEHASGRMVRLSAALIDIGGHHTDEVYRFCVGRAGRKVRPCQGQAQRGKEICGRPSKKNRYRVPVVPIGTDTAKDTIFSRLKLQAPGPGYIHFPEWLDSEYIAQLTAEKAVRRYKRGKGSVREYVKVRTRNEALDLSVYSLACLYSLGAGVVKSLARRAAELSVPVEAPREAKTNEAAAPRPRPVRFRFQ